MTSFGTYPSITTPFGSADANIQMPDVNYGITETDACPYANGGTQVSRHKMNGLGYLATVGAFLDRIGYPYGWTRNVAYPKGAIVTMFNGTTVKEFVNTVEHNTEEPPSDSDITDYTEEGSRGWKPVYLRKNYSYFPDYTNRELIKEFKVKSGQSSSVTISPKTGGWALVTREIEGWDELTSSQKFGLMNSNSADMVEVRLGVHSIYQWDETDDFSIKQYESGRASRFFPCPSVLPVSVTRVPSYIKSVTVNVYIYALESVE